MSEQHGSPPFDEEVEVSNYPCVLNTPVLGIDLLLPNTDKKGESDKQFLSHGFSVNKFKS